MPPPYTLPGDVILGQEAEFQAEFQPEFESGFESELSADCPPDFLENASLDILPRIPQEEYEHSEISLDDLDSHYADVVIDFSDAHTDFLEEAHTAVFPPEAKDLFIGQNGQNQQIGQIGQPEQNESNEQMEQAQQAKQNEQHYENDESESKTIDWDAFVEYCISHDFPKEYIPYIRLSSGKISGDECVVRISSDTALQQLHIVQKEVKIFLVDFLGKALKIRYTADAYERRTLEEMMEAMHEHPQIKMLQKEFGASLLRCSDLKPGYKIKGDSFEKHE